MAYEPAAWVGIDRRAVRMVARQDRYSSARRASGRALPKLSRQVTIIINGNRSDSSVNTAQHLLELFDLTNDPDEMNNLYTNPEYREIKLQQELQRLQNKFKDPVSE